MEIKCGRRRSPVIDSAEFGFGQPASPPTPAALRFVTTGHPAASSLARWQELGAEEDGVFRDLAKAFAKFASSAEVLSARSQPSLKNPYGKMPPGKSKLLFVDLARALSAIDTSHYNETQQGDFSALRKIARQFADFCQSRPESLVRLRHAYMVDVLLDAGLNVVGQRDPINVEAKNEGKMCSPSIRENVARAKMSAALAHGSHDEDPLSHIYREERMLADNPLPPVADSHSPALGMTAHDWAVCFYAKQNAVAFAAAQKARDYCREPTDARQEALRAVLRSAELGLRRAGTLTDNPFSSRYNDFRVVLHDFAQFLELGRVYQNLAHPRVLKVVRRFSKLLSTEARLEAWSFPGVELRDKPPSGAKQGQHFPGLAAWSVKFRPNRTWKKLAQLPSGSKPGCLDSYLKRVEWRLLRAITEKRAVLPGGEPFAVGMYSAAESARLPDTLIEQTVVMQEEHRVAPSERTPRCGIMTIAPKNEIAGWANEASVFTVQKGDALLGALYSFTSQDKQPALSEALKKLISTSPSAGLLGPGTPVICTELVLTKKDGHQAFGRVPGNRYQLMHALWAGSVCARYYEYETVLAIGVCRKEPLNTAISSHLRLGWKIVPGVEFRFNEAASYYVMYQELHPRRALIAAPKEPEASRSARIDSSDYDFLLTAAPHEAMRELSRYARLPRWNLAKHSFIGLHANRTSLAVISTLVGLTLRAGPPPAFATPKEFLQNQCSGRPVDVQTRRNVELAKNQLSREQRMELLEDCLRHAGRDSLLFVDKYYLLDVAPNEQKMVLEELGHVVQLKYPDRAIRSIVKDEVRAPGAKLLTASIQLE